MSRQGARRRAARRIPQLDRVVPTAAGERAAAAHRTFRLHGISVFFSLPAIASCSPTIRQPCPCVTDQPTPTLTAVSVPVFHSAAIAGFHITS
jgi:hypothetical protein